MRTDSAVVHAGESVRIAGFARTRARGVLRASTGSAAVSLRDGATTIAEQRVPLDAAGAFTTAFLVPANATAGEYTVLAQAAGGDRRSDARRRRKCRRPLAGGTRRMQRSLRSSPRRSAARSLVARRRYGARDGRAIAARLRRRRRRRARLGRRAGGLTAAVTTDESGNATVPIPHPNDELGSTYGVRVESGGATATTRVVVPTADAAIRLEVDRTEQSIGTPLGFDVYADTLDGKPLGGATVSVALAHGASRAQQNLTLDAGGHARGSFSAPDLGTNFLLAWVDRNGRAIDAAQVRMDPQAASPHRRRKRRRARASRSRRLSSGRHDDGRRRRSGRARRSVDHLRERAWRRASRRARDAGARRRTLARRATRRAS